MLPYLSTNPTLSFLTLPTYIPTCLPAYLPAYLPTHLPTLPYPTLPFPYPSTYLATYLRTYLPTYHGSCPLGWLWIRVNLEGGAVPYPTFLPI